MNDDMAPCPHCGGTRASAYLFTDAKTKAKMWAIDCPTCPGPVDTKAKAIETWNKRDQPTGATGADLLADHIWRHAKRRDETFGRLQSIEFWGRDELRAAIAAALAERGT